MKSSRMLLCLLLSATLSRVTFAAEPAMRLTIPRTSHAPTLDGKLAPGEWDDATAVTGVINQLDGLAHPRQATFWLKYDDKNVYVAQRSTLLPGEKKAPPATFPWVYTQGLNMAFDRLNVPEAMPPLYFRDNQNTVTIALAPNRINSGDTPSHYRYMSNIATTQPVRRELCDQIKGIKFISISSSLDSLDARKVPNNAKSLSSFSADDTVWESEYAIPLADMKVEKAPVGEEWGILLARDYPQQDQNAIVQSDSYRFDFVSRAWRSLALMSAYHIEKTYAHHRLVENEPVLQVLDLGDLLNGRVRPKLVLLNPTAQPTSVTVKVTVGDKTQEQAVALAANERKEFNANEIAVPGGLAQILQLSVISAGGKPLLQQTLPFRVGYGRDRTTLVPDVWLAGEPKYCGGQVCVMPSYNPIRNTLWSKVKVPTRPGIEPAAAAEISVRRAGEDKPFVTYPLTGDIEHYFDYQLKTTLPELKPGVYEITASFYGKDTKPQDAGAAVMNASNLNPAPNQGRKLLARSRELFIRYDHAKDLPWIDNKIGVSDKVLPPWTPMESKQEGAAINLSCWGRTYTVDGSGLPTQVKVLDENILSAPVHVEITRDGKPVPLTPAAPQPSLTAARPNEATFTGALKGDGWNIATSAKMEYDGYIQFRIRLEPQGEQSVDRIKFVVPITPQQAVGLHAASGGNMRTMVSTIQLKKENGPLWDSSQQAAGPDGNGAGMLVGNFKPYVWIGGVKRGIAFMSDDDRGWVPDDTKQVSAIQVVRDDKGANLILNLVARPFKFDHAREVVFSLQATPIRLLRDDFRAHRLRTHLGSAFVGFYPDWWGWDGCQLAFGPDQLYLGGQGSAPSPINWELNTKWNKEGGASDWKNPVGQQIVVTKYQAMNAIFHTPEIDDPRIPGLQGANCYGYLQSEITGHRDCYDASISKTELEYRIWRYQRWIKETGLHGFYFDNAFSACSANPDAGLGYAIDLHDRPTLNGRIQTGFAWTGIREILKRLRTVITEEGHEPMLWMHATDTYMISAYAFADVLLDGEDGAFLTPEKPWFSEKWPPQYMQVINDSPKWGLETTMLELRGGFVADALGRASLRDMLGYMMLHDVEAAAFRYIDWRGLNLKRKADFLPYWDPAVNSVLRTGNETVLASAFRQNNKLLVIVFNRSGNKQTGLKVTVDPVALGLAPPAGRAWLVEDTQPAGKRDPNDPNWPLEGAMSAQTSGKVLGILLDIAPHDYRLLRIE